MHTYVHCCAIYNSKDLEPTQMSIDDILDKKIWPIYTMEYYAAIKKDESCLCRDMDKAENHYSQQTDTRKENHHKKKHHMFLLISGC